MALVWGERVAETTTTTGTGPFFLLGNVTGYQEFSNIMAADDMCFGTIEALDSNGFPSGDWVSGILTYNNDNSVTVTAILDSSAGGSAVAFAAGAKRVILAASASLFSDLGVGFFPIVDRDLATPPGSPTNGQVYIVAGSPTGAWTGHAGHIAAWLGTWVFTVPAEGMAIWIADEDLFLVYNGSAWAQPVPEATNSEIWAGSATVRYLSPAKLYTSSAPVALTSRATITPDGNNGFNFTLTLAHNATLANPSNFKTGQSGVIVITQDGTGSRTMAYGTNWKFPGGAPVLSTAAGTVDLLSYYVVSGSLIVASLTKAYSS